MYIIVFTEDQSRWVEVLALKNITAASVARAFVDSVILRFGTHDTLIYDQGSDFTANLSLLSLGLILILRRRFVHIPTDLPSD